VARRSRPSREEGCHESHGQGCSSSPAVRL
jgi:hypothetical protein